MSTNVPGPEGALPQTKAPEASVSPAVVAQATSATKRLSALFRHALALAFWMYVLVKLFAFDIDRYAAEKYFPSYAWLLDYKFLFIIGTLATAWLLLKNKTTLLWFAFVIFYPVLLLFWYCPKFLLERRSWILTFATINAVLSFFTSLRFNFVSLSIFLISLVVAGNSSDPVLLWSAMGSLFIILCLLYVHRFSMIFRPSSVFLVYTKIFSLKAHFQKTLVRETSTRQLSYEQLPAAQQQLWVTNLQMSVLYNSACLFVSRKLREFQRSRLNLISYVLSLLLILILTVTGFAAINCGLYKVEPKSFSLIGQPTFFIFFYYSFKTFLFGSIPEVTAVAPMSEAMAMVESFFAILLTVILVSLFIFVKSERFISELDGVIKDIESEGAGMADLIQSEYLLNVDDALARLRELNAGLVDLIYQLSRL